MITQERLKEILNYDPTTGDFTWKINRGPRAKAGDVAGCEGPRDYRAIGVDGTLYRAHRLAFLWMAGEFPPADVDHINGDPSDNRWQNLRTATRSQNGGNSKRNSNNATGYKGTCFDKRRGKFMALIMVDGKRKCLGRFDDAERAHEAYMAAAKTYFGDFARAI